ncbi:MAG TPA: hypothetical protein VKA48_01865 [Gammaproteobacteria bacterium]|nr:hypothetical protein [Gammaproteobacteria bacterium]
MTSPERLPAAGEDLAVPAFQRRPVPEHLADRLPERPVRRPAEGDLETPAFMRRAEQPIDAAAVQIDGQVYTGDTHVDAYYDWAVRTGRVDEGADIEEALDAAYDAGVVRDDAEGFTDTGGGWLTREQARGRVQGTGQAWDESSDPLRAEDTRLWGFTDEMPAAGAAGDDVSGLVRPEHPALPAPATRALPAGRGRGGHVWPSGETIHMPPARWERDPHSIGFQSYVREQHRRWRELDRKGRLTPAEREEFAQIDQELNRLLIRSYDEGLPSPLGYQELYSRVERALRHTERDAGTAEEWLAELRQAPGGTSDREIRDRLPALFGDLPGEDLFTHRSIQSKAEQLRDNAAKRLLGQIEAIRNNPKIPEKIRAERIAEMEARVPKVEDYLDQATSLVQQQNAPRYTREQILEMLGERPLDVRVETRTVDPTIRDLATRNLDRRTIAEAQDRLPAAREAHSVALRRASANMEGALARIRGLVTEQEIYPAPGRATSSFPTPFAHQATREAIAGAADGDDAVRAVEELYPGIRLTDEVRTQVRQTNRSLYAMNDAFQEQSRLENLVSQKQGKAPTFGKYLTPVDGEKEAGYTAEIYRMGEETGRRAYQPEGPVQRRSTHFSGMDDLEIAHTRRTIEDDEALSFLQELQSDVGQGIQRMASNREGKKAPFLGNKDWLDLMMRDQMHRAAVEGREGLFLQPPEGARNVSGGGDQPSTYYRDVAPRHFERAAKDTGLESRGERFSFESTDSKLDPETAREMAEDSVREDPESYTGTSVEEIQEQLMYNEPFSVEPYLRDRGDIPDALFHELRYAGTDPNAIEEAVELYVEAAREGSLGEADMEDFEHFRRDWQLDRKGVSKIADDLFSDIEAVEGEHMEALYEQATERFEGEIEYAIEREQEFIMDNWDEYYMGGMGAEEEMDAPLVRIPMDARLELQKRGTYMMGLAPFMLPTGLSAGLLAQDRRKKGERRGLLH